MLVILPASPMSIGHCLLATSMAALSLTSWQPVVNTISNDKLINNIAAFELLINFSIVLYI